jgi:death-on-curing protein
MIILTKNQIIKLHEDLINEHGGDDGIRDDGLLESAINAPLQTFDEQPLFPSIHQKAVRMGYGLIKNHPFVDGNKRIGAHVMLVLLAINGIELDYTQKELYEMILDIASGEQTYDNMLEWALNHTTT